MKLHIKQKVFSLKSRFNIFDENGETKYTAEGVMFSLGRKLYVRDNSGEEVIFISQKLLSFKPKYIIHAKGNEPVEMVKNFTLLTHEYSIPQWNVKIVGDFFAHEYSVYANGNEIARMSKQWLSWGDTYVIDIPDPYNELLALAAILVVDCCMEDSQNG